MAAADSTEATYMFILNILLLQKIHKHVDQTFIVTYIDGFKKKKD